MVLGRPIKWLTCPQAPICGVDLDDLDRKARSRHIQSCLRQLQKKDSKLKAKTLKGKEALRSTMGVHPRPSKLAVSEQANELEVTEGLPQPSSHKEEKLRKSLCGSHVHVLSASVSKLIYDYSSLTTQRINST